VRHSVYYKVLTLYLLQLFGYSGHRQEVQLFHQFLLLIQILQILVTCHTPSTEKIVLP